MEKGEREGKDQPQGIEAAQEKREWEVEVGRVSPFNVWGTGPLKVYEAQVPSARSPQGAGPGVPGS